MYGKTTTTFNYDFTNHNGTLVAPSQVHIAVFGEFATPAFEQLNSRGIDVLLNTPWQGANYSKRIWKNSNVIASQLQQTLTKAIMTGMSQERALWEI